MEIDSEKLSDIRDVCGELGISEEEYVNWVFTWGKWIINKSRERKIICALDPMTNAYTELSAPPLDKLKSPPSVH